MRGPRMRTFNLTLTMPMVFKDTMNTIDTFQLEPDLLSASAVRQKLAILKKKSFMIFSMRFEHFILEVGNVSEKVKLSWQLVGE